MFFTCPSVCRAHKLKLKVENKSQAGLDFTSLQTRDMTNHNYMPGSLFQANIAA